MELAATSGTRGRSPPLATGQALAAAIRVVPWPVWVFVGYYLGAQLGFALTFEPRPVSTLWSPNSILLAAFLLTPTRSWWIVLAAAFPAHLASQVGADVPIQMSLLWFVSNSTEGLIGAAGIRRFVAPPVRLDRLHTVGVFVFFAGFLAPFLSTFLDLFFVQLVGWGEGSYWILWRTRFFSNALAAMTVIPVILAWANGGITALGVARPARYAEACVLILLLLAVSSLVFGVIEAEPPASAALLYAPLPFLLWAAVRFGPTGVSTSTLVVVLLAIWNSIHGLGPFVAPLPETNALSIQLLFITLAVTLMTLTALVEERRRALEAADQSREQLTLALQAAQMSTLDWPLRPASPARPSSGEDSGGGPEEPLEELLCRVHPDDREAVESALRSGIGEGGSYETEFRVLREDGSTGWVMGQGKVLHDEMGRPARVIGIQADISGRKAAEALAAAESRILEMMADGAPVVDVLTRLTQLVEAEAPGLLCSVLLLDTDGVHIRHAAGPNLPPDYVRAIDGVAIGPRVGSCGTAMYLRRPVVVTDIENDPLWESYRDVALAHGLRACWSIPIVSHRQEVLGSFAMYYRRVRGPTPRERKLLEFATHLAAIALERANAEAEAERQRRELAHLGRVAALGGFSGALAHELSQPLAAILSDAQAAQRLLRKDPPALRELDEILSDIVIADRRATEVIDRLRALLVKRKGERVLLDLHGVLRETLHFARSDLAHRGVRVELELSPELPLVLGDRVELEQVLLNLLTNACDAMAELPPRDRVIQIVTRHGDGSVRLAIVDRGGGVPSDMLARISEPFVTSKPSGLGLGLSISRSILLAHGGRLTFQNNPDRGATFEISLPAAAAAAEPAETPKAEPTPEPRRRRPSLPHAPRPSASIPSGLPKAPEVALAEEMHVLVEVGNPVSHRGYVIAVQ